MSEQRIRLAHIHLQQADVHRKKSELDPAIESFKKALDIYKELAADDSAFWNLVADTIESIAATYKAADRLEEAEAAFREAITLRETLVKLEKQTSAKEE